MAQLVREIMVEPAVTVQSDTTLSEAARLMRDADIGGVIVVDAMKPIGMVTDRDIVVRGVAEVAQSGNMTVGEICSTDLVSVRPEDEVSQAKVLMRRAAVRRLPVIDGGQVVGVLSLGEVAIDRDETSVLAEISSADPNS
ncbi:MAG TPA: CBS domain-containing protein [Rugosimonospora sp.]|jgi:CBS domain-containing protein